MPKLKKHTTESEQKTGEKSLFVGGRRAIYGGFSAAAVALAGQWLIGRVYTGYEARQFLESMSSSALYFGSAIVTAAATILALMLTILSLTSQSDEDFDQIFFLRVERIAKLATIILMGGILLLLFLSIPIKESDNVPGSWFTTIYYTLIFILAALAGLLITIVLMLLNAISSLIEVVRPSAEREEEKVERETERDNQKAK